MDREVTVRHVFLGFVERKESGMRNPESGIRNAEFATLQCHLLEHIVYFYTFFTSRNSARITIIISSLTLQDIEQNVSKTLACYSKVSPAAT